MFKNITDYAYQRSKKEAFGFYLAYLLGGIVLGGIAGGLSAVVTGASGEDAFHVSLRAGTAVGVLYSMALSVIVIKNKKLSSGLDYSMVLIAGIVALFIGSLGGVIPAAWLTTRTNGK